MPSKSKVHHRLERSHSASGRSPRVDHRGNAPKVRQNASVDCGWGRLLFGQTFDDLQRLANSLREERPGKRDIALYLDEPHVILSLAPQELFLDPSHTFRLWLERYQPGRRPVGD